MTDEERQDILRRRKLQQLPWHTPPHRYSETTRYLMTAACYEHQDFIGASPERMAAFEAELLAAFAAGASQIHAHCILPNHYHALITSLDVMAVLKKLGQLHGRTSYGWNGVDDCRGRSVWYGAAETSMKCERHFWATINYVHHNPVKHGYVKRWLDWPFSSAREYVETVGLERAEAIWREYPCDDMGRDWDS